MSVESKQGDPDLALSVPGDLTRVGTRIWNKIPELGHQVANGGYHAVSIVRLWRDERAWATIWEWRVRVLGDSELTVMRLEKFVGRRT